MQSALYGAVKGLRKLEDVVAESLAPLDLGGDKPEPDYFQRKLRDLEQRIRRGPAFPLSDVPAFLDAAKHALTVGVDDRKFLLEDILTALARSTDDSEVGAALTQLVIEILYKDLPHPPSGYLAVPRPADPAALALSSQPVPYPYRSTDGSNYNPLFPSLGRAGAPYARSVPSTNTTLATSALPDPALVFDTLLKRDAFHPHPGGVNALFFAFADLIIHSLFNTNAKDWSINDSSSYLDLSPLYGSTHAQLDTIRRKDGTGMIFNDTFADNRPLFMPPAVAALLVLFSRNHNYVAEKLLAINESGSFRSPPPQDGAARAAQDDELFARARLVNCAFFVRVIFADYVGAILGLTRDGLTWRLDPMQTLRELSHDLLPQGAGNVVSIEFNLLYRWHATLSAQDTKWTEGLFDKLFPGKSYSSITVDDFARAARGFLAPSGDPRTWTFGDLQRGPDGRFPDADLARILQDATEAGAGAFRARGTPEVLRVVELLALQQARSWGVCSLNEFRQFLGLRPYKHFKEWNPDPEIWKAAEALYHDIDNLELHVGLQAEEAKRPMPGAGLCPGYTISRAILADAVVLTRGDRFLSVDYTPAALTAWGYADTLAPRGDANGALGGALAKLLFRALPGCYAGRSAHALLPFLVPGFARNALLQGARAPAARAPAARAYAWARPPPPPRVRVVRDGAGARAVLRAGGAFEADADARLRALVRGVPLDRMRVREALEGDAALRRRCGAQLADAARALLREKAWAPRAGARYVDVVRDVLNLVPVRWLAGEFGIPIKDEESPGGVYREQELYQGFADLADYVYFNLDEENDWALRRAAEKAAAHAAECATATLHARGGGGGGGGGLLAHLRRPGGARAPPEELAAAAAAELAPSAAPYAKALAALAAWYLDPANARARADAARAGWEGAGWVREPLRLNPPIPAAWRTATADAALPGGARVAKGDRVFVSVAQANRDPAVFGSEPGEAVYDRPAGKDGIWGVGEYGMMTEAFFEATAPAVLQAVLGLPGLARAPGALGRMQSFTETVRGCAQEMYVAAAGRAAAWPAHMLVQYSDGGE